MGEKHTLCDKINENLNLLKKSNRHLIQLVLLYCEKIGYAFYFYFFYFQSRRKENNIN